MVAADAEGGGPLNFGSVEGQFFYATTASGTHRGRITEEALLAAVESSDLPDTRVDGQAYIDFTMFGDQLDEFEEQLAAGDDWATWTVGGAAVGSVLLSAGYVAWSINGGYLLASALSSLPAWRMVDPLPILDASLSKKKRKKKGEEEEEEEVPFL